MNDTRSFTIVIIKTLGGHRAYAPGFSHVVGEGIGRDAAYKNFKKELDHFIHRRTRLDDYIPQDKTVAVKNLRINLREFRAEEELL